MFELDGREDVFAAITDLIYLPPRSTGELTAPDGGELAWRRRPPTRGTTPDGSTPPRSPSRSAAVESATRQVNNLLSADVAHAERIIVVEVLTPGGNWSSWPPHKHDEWSDCEVPLEEIYYFRVQGEGGFGLHRTYTKDRYDRRHGHGARWRCVPHTPRLPRTLCGRTRTPSLLPQCDGRPRRRAGLEGMRRPGSCLGSHVVGWSSSPILGSR